MLRYTLLIATCLFATALFGQDDAQYKTWMKSLGPNVGAVRTAIMAKDTAAAASAADKLAATFTDVAEYWQKKNVADAVTLAQNARDDAKAIAAAKSSDDQSASLMKLQQQCGACHKAHRDGAAPNFTIK